MAKHIHAWSAGDPFDAEGWFFRLQGCDDCGGAVRLLFTSVPTSVSPPSADWTERLRRASPGSRHVHEWAGGVDVQTDCEHQLLRQICVCGLATRYLYPGTGEHLTAAPADGYVIEYDLRAHSRNLASFLSYIVSCLAAPRIARQAEELRIS